MRAFVIGDVHGHIKRLTALAEKAGVVKNGVKDSDVLLIQLGDLGHFGADRRAEDLACYSFADKFMDIVLWGNHDRAVFSEVHRFAGFTPPMPETEKIMIRMRRQFRLQMMLENLHGYALTHAGIHPEFGRWFNRPRRMSTSRKQQFYDWIGPERGGRDMVGGILWRDASEDLWDEIPQIFGHTRGPIRQYGQSLCIDTGGISDGNLAGIWLPDRKIVAVGKNAELFEQFSP